MSYTPEEFTDYWKIRVKEIHTFLKKTKRVKNRAACYSIAGMSADEMLGHYLKIVAKRSNLPATTRQFINAEMIAFKQRTDD